MRLVHLLILVALIALECNCTFESGHVPFRASQEAIDFAVSGRVNNQEPVIGGIQSMAPIDHRIPSEGEASSFRVAFIGLAQAWHQFALEWQSKAKTMPVTEESIRREFKSWLKTASRHPLEEKGTRIPRYYDAEMAKRLEPIMINWSNEIRLPYPKNVFAMAMAAEQVKSSLYSFTKGGNTLGPFLREYQNVQHVHDLVQAAYEHAFKVSPYLSRNIRYQEARSSQMKARSPRGANRNRLDRWVLEPMTEPEVNSRVTQTTGRRNRLGEQTRTTVNGFADRLSRWKDELEHLPDTAVDELAGRIKYNWRF